MARKDSDQIAIRRYLLRQLSPAKEQELETRLLDDTELFEELEIGEDELIDDYVAGNLSKKELEAFKTSFLATDARRDNVRFAQTVERSAQLQKKRERKVVTIPSYRRFQLFSSPLAMAALVLLMLGAGFGIWRAFFYQSDVDKGLIALNSAYRNARPLESRISQLDYAPFITTRGPGGPQFNESELKRAELTLLEALNKNPTPEVHQALGKVYLAKNNFDEAIREFNSALSGGANNSQLYSDLGAAWLEKGKIDRDRATSGKELEDFARSLEYLDKALTLKPDLLEALFNRALVHQQMMLPEQAEEDWKKYLEKDSKSQWAVEAQQNLMRLQQGKQKTSRTREELLKDFLTAYQTHDDEGAWQVLSKSREALSGKLIWDQLLDQYLTALANEDQVEARDALAAIAYAGQLESHKAGDEFVPSLVRYYRSTSKLQQQKLLEARTLIKQGNEDYFQHRLADASDSYKKAQALFADVNDEPESRYAQHWIAYCDLERGKTSESIEVLENLARSLRRDKQQWLLMRTMYFLSTANHNLNEYSKAIAYNRQALTLAEHLNDAMGIFNSTNILVFQYTSTGNLPEAMTYAKRSLSIMPDCPLNELQISRFYTVIALAFDAAMLYHAAVDYQQEALRHTLAIGHLQNLSAGYARLGLMYGQLGAVSEAERNLDLSAATAKQDPDEAQQKQMMALSALQRGHFYRDQHDFKRALASYNQSIDLSDNVHFKYSVYEAHKNRLFCYMTLQDDASAATELKTTLDLAEKYRSTILEGANRIDFFDIEQSVYDLAMDFAYSRLYDSQQAFQYSEDSRSRTLLDSVAGHTQVSEKDQNADIKFESVTKPLTLVEIQRRLPDDAQVVQYGVLRDKVLIWIISKGKFATAESSISSKSLEQKVTDYLSAAETPGGSTGALQSSAKELCDLLFKPAQSFLDANKVIYIVPDKFLGSLPFGTLISSDSGKFLIEDYRIEGAPSSTLLVMLSEIAATKETTRDEHLLSVGNPSFDANEFPSLQNLPAADREAEQVASYYRSTSVFTGARATYEKINSEMTKSDVIHLALHSVTEGQTPLQSKLILARDSAVDPSTPNGSLAAYQIYKLKLPRTRLAVLSACQTGTGHYYGGEGMVSLARPFLSAGVPLVVVSLWPVDSEATAELMISFHKHRKQDNISSVEALRRAQLDMLHKPSERFSQPFFWGAFIVIGGAANF